MVKGQFPFPLHLTVQFELRIQSDNKLNTQTLILYDCQESQKYGCGKSLDEVSGISHVPSSSFGNSFWEIDSTGNRFQILYGHTL